MTIEFEGRRLQKMNNNPPLQLSAIPLDALFEISAFDCDSGAWVRLAPEFLIESNFHPSISSGGGVA